MTLLKVNNRPSVKSWNGLVNDLFADLENNFAGFGQSQTNTPVNISESENAFNLELLAPGYSKEQIALNVEKNVLTISGENKNTNPVENGPKQIRNEFSIKSFKRSFTLDDKIETEAIEAKFEGGILKVTLPKKADVKPEVKQITVQ